MPLFRLRRSALLMVVLLAASACGADIDEEPVGEQTTATTLDGTRVASERFDGEFVVGQVRSDDQPFELETVATVEIETIFGALTVIPGCNTYFGSFTLGESGDASFTIAGGSKEDCGSLNAQEDTVLSVLRAVDSWTEVDGGFRFEGANGSSLTLSR